MPSIGDIVRTITIRGVADGVDAATAATKGLGDAFNAAAGAASEGASQIDQAFNTIQQSISGAAGGAGGGLSIFASVGIGAVAAGTALGVFLDWVSKTNKDLADMQTNARNAGLSLAEFQSLQFAGTSQGISSSAIAEGAQKMAANLDEATRSTNDLSKLLDANNIKFKDGSALLISQNQLWDTAAQLISRAANAQQQIKIAEMLGLSKEWVPVLNQGAEAFEATREKAAQLGLEIDGSTIQKAADFDRAWREASTVFSTWMKAQIADLIPSIDDLITKAQNLASTAKGVGQGVTDESLHAGGFITDSEAAANAQAVAEAWKIINDPTLGTFFERMALAAKAVAGALDEQTKALLDNSIAAQTDAKMWNDIANGWENAAAASQKLSASGGKSGPTTKIPGDDSGSRDAFDRTADSIAKHAATLSADTLAIGQSTAAIAGMRAEFQLLDAARAADKGVTDDQIAQYTKFRATMDAQDALQAAHIKLNEDDADSFSRLTAQIKAATQANAEANVNSSIAFGRKTALLSPEDAQIANELKSIFGTDVPAALASSQAAALRFNQSLTDTRTLTENFADNFGQSMLQGKSFTDSLTGALKNLESQLLSMITRKLVDSALGGLFGAFGGGGTGAGIFGGAPTSTVPAFALNTGGMVGIDGALRYVHPAYFENAPRFDTGGSISDGGVPIIAHPGERVLNRSEAAAYNSGGKPVVIQPIINNYASDQVSATASQGPDPSQLVISITKKAEARGDFDGVRRGRFAVRPQKVF